MSADRHAVHMLGPLTLYLAGRSREALALTAAAADSARSSRDNTFIMYALTHVGLNMAALGRYAEATKVFHEARSFGRKYGAIPMLARHGDWRLGSRAFLSADVQSFAMANASILLVSGRLT